jgi:dTDP-4-amino-4,6-dideoxygalactose transaminase/GT2 family glycosyltransferase
MINLGKPSFGQEEIDAVAEVIRSGWVGRGKNVEEFEKEFASYSGAKYAIAVNGCTVGLYLSLKRLGIGVGDEVIVPSMTWNASAAVVVALGATVVFADVVEGIWCLDAEDVRRKITKNTKAVIPVHFAGQFATGFENFEIPVIYDSAHRIAKNAFPGITSVHSFYVTKNITTVRGGMVLTNDEEEYKWLKQARTSGINHDVLKRYKDGNFEYEVEDPSWNFDMSDIEATIGRVQLGKIDEFTAKREAIVAKYNQAFGSNNKGNHLYHILVENRPEFIAKMKENGIQCGVHYFALHLMKGYQKYNQGSLPVTEFFSACNVSMPLYTDLTDSDIQHIIDQTLKLAKFNENKPVGVKNMGSQFLTTTNFIKGTFLNIVENLFFRNFEYGQELPLIPGYKPLKILQIQKNNRTNSIGLYLSEKGEQVIIKSLRYRIKNLAYAQILNEINILTTLHKKNAEAFQPTESNVYRVKIPIVREVINQTGLIGWVTEYADGNLLFFEDQNIKLEVIESCLNYFNNLTLINEEKLLFVRSPFQMFVIFPLYWIKALFKDLNQIKLYFKLAILFYSKFSMSLLLSPSYILSHKDLHSKNIVVQDKLVTALDLQVAVRGEKETDLSIVSRLYFNELGVEKIKKILSKFLTDRKQVDSFVRLTIFFAVQSLALDKKHFIDYDISSAYIEALEKNILPFLSALNTFEKNENSSISIGKPKLNFTVAVAAYNAEKNVGPMLKSLLSQKEDNYKLEKIIVYSDASNDQTVVKAREILDSRILVIDGKVRSGFSGAIQKILNFSQSDFTVVLNDDIKISDDLFLEKLNQTFISEENIGLVTGNPRPIEGKTFIEKAAASSYRVYEKFRYSINNGNNPYTCDGKILCFSKDFKQAIIFPEDSADLGNVDAFVYFACLSLGFKYKHNRNAIVYYKNPTNVRDYYKWMIRNNSEYFIMKKNFGPMVEKEYKKPRSTFIYYCFIEFIKNPVGSLAIFLIGLYVKFRARAFSRNFNSKWSLVSSTKQLD